MRQKARELRKLQSVIEFEKKKKENLSTIFPLIPIFSKQWRSFGFRLNIDRFFLVSKTRTGKKIVHIRDARISNFHSRARSKWKFMHEQNWLKYLQLQKNYLQNWGLLFVENRWPVTRLLPKPFRRKTIQKTDLRVALHGKKPLFSRSACSVMRYYNERILG